MASPADLHSPCESSGSSDLPCSLGTCHSADVETGALTGSAADPKGQGWQREGTSQSVKVCRGGEHGPIT